MEDAEYAQIAPRTDISLSLKEQLMCLIGKNLEYYPEACRWVMEVMPEDDNFGDHDQSFNKWYGHPYKQETPNKIALIKWHRGEYATSLKDAKHYCENFIDAINNGVKEHSLNEKGTMK